MKGDKTNDFDKIVSLPKDLKEELEVQAIREGHGNLKAMIRNVVIDNHTRYKGETSND